MLTIIKWIFLSFTSLVLIYGCVLSFHAFLYSDQYKNENLIIFSDQLLPDNISVISDAVLQRVKKSEYYNPHSEYRVFICNETWRWRLVANMGPGQGAVNYTWFRQNSFIRPSVIAENRIIPPAGGLADAEERDLVYFISHEVTHGMMVQALGAVNFQFATQGWIKEGYADLIGKKSFAYEDNLAQLKNNERRLSESSGLYVRYQLLLLYFLQEKSLTMAEIIQQDISQPQAIEMLLASENIKK